MKFIYEYRSSDNVRHTGRLEAADREAAFAALKANGIRPGRLAEAPGVFNKLFGKGKRWMAIAVLAALAALLACLTTRAKKELTTVVSTFESPVRRQILGDSAIIEKQVREGWAEVFASQSDRFLASFAIPGMVGGTHDADETELLASAARPVVVAPSDAIETIQIKSIVNGMKDELRTFVAKGGSVRRYKLLLLQRQEEELAYFNRARIEIETEIRSGATQQSVMELWERRNEGLRQMGIKLLPISLLEKK